MPGELFRDSLAHQVRFTVWATRRALDGLAKVAEADLDRNLGSSFSCTKHLVCHMYGGDLWLWTMLNPGSEPPYPDWLDRDGVGVGFPEMKDDYEALLAGIEGQVAHIEDLRAGLTFCQETLPSFSQEIPRWQAIANVFNHATYHRGQLAAHMRQLGYAPLDTDLIHYYFEAESKPWPLPRSQ